MTESTKREAIAIAGASGELGKLTIKHITRISPSTRIKAFVRSQSAALTELQKANPNLSIVILDYSNPAQLAKEFADVHCVVSTLQGLGKVIIDVQMKLLKAAVSSKVPRFIPSDFGANIFRIPIGMNRNYDLRREFHNQAGAYIRQNCKGDYKIQLTTIMQGAFMEFLTMEQSVALDPANSVVPYIGSADQISDFTTWDNTAEFAAYVALDKGKTASVLQIAGDQVNAKDIARIASKVTGREFKLKFLMPLWTLSTLIPILQVIAPGKNDNTLPIWQAMQYAHVMSSGLTTSDSVDNHLYPVKFTKVEDHLREHAAGLKAKEVKKSGFFGYALGAVVVAGAAFYFAQNQI